MRRLAGSSINHSSVSVNWVIFLDFIQLTIERERASSWFRNSPFSVMLVFAHFAEQLFLL